MLYTTTVLDTKKIQENCVVFVIDVERLLMVRDGQEMSPNTLAKSLLIVAKRHCVIAYVENVFLFFFSFTK